MTTYEITATVPEDLIPEYERYMCERHVPDLLATGCFVAASFSRSSPGRYRIRYEAPDQATLDRYLVEHAARLRTHMSDSFPNVELSREVWLVIRAW